MKKLSSSGTSEAVGFIIDHSPEKWPEFRKRYCAELNANPHAWAAILEAARHGDLPLLYASSDFDHNNAIVLRDYLLTRLRRIDAKEGQSGPVDRI